MFQTKLKRQGISLSQWEIFTLFEYLNTTVSKQVFYEPQRYHAILFQDFYTLITGKDDYREDLAQRTKNADKKTKGKQSKSIPQAQRTEAPKQVKQVRDQDDALHLAANLNNQADAEESDPMAFSQESDDDDFDDSDTDEDLASGSGDKYRQRKRDEKKPYN